MNDVYLAEELLSVIFNDTDLLSVEKCKALGVVHKMLQDRLSKEVKEWARHR